MNIECPSCSTDNRIELGDHIACSNCKKTFGGHAYKKIKKPLLSATTALFLGVYGTYKVDAFFDQPRYPIRVEYELIDSCLNSSNIAMSRRQLSIKREVCVCALEETMKEISYKELDRSETEFLSRFRSGIAACR